MSNKIKNTIVKVKTNTKIESDDNSNEYASRKIKNSTEIVSNKINTTSSKVGKKALLKSKDNIKKEIKKFDNIKTKIKTRKNVKKELESVLSASKKAKNIYISKSINKIKNSSRNTVKTSKKVVKATIIGIKAIISGMKSLIFFLIAGGWLAFIIIIIVCLIALLCSSIFGIFFSSEKTGSSITMSSAISEINQEMADKILKIQKDEDYDDYKIKTDRAEWKEVLSIYVAKITKGDNEQEVLTLDTKKIEILRDIFWDMNEITTQIKTEGDDKTILYINIKHKTVDEMMNKYKFNNSQKEQVKELLSDEYASMWASVIFGTPVGSPSMVQIALSQVGNVGGEPYWSWYGFDSRVEWCAIFVSWVANQAGYINTNVIPKFNVCQNGVDWFKALGEWQDKGYVPKAGDIIFFDWEVDGLVNHVGIVEKVENGKIYTIEGNSTDDECRRLEYSINSNVIYGYGIPAY